MATLRGLMEKLNKPEMEIVFEYCFNEFLKMCDFLKGELNADNKKFLHFVLHTFKEKVDNSKDSDLVALDKFPLPKMEK